MAQKRTLWGGGALQFLDLRLREDGGENKGARVVSVEVVARDAASDGQDGNGERVGVSTGADTERRTLGRGLRARRPT